MYCYLKFKLRYLENLKLFSIRVKDYLSLYFYEKNNINDNDAFLFIDNHDVLFNKRMIWFFGLNYLPIYKSIS